MSGVTLGDDDSNKCVESTNVEYTGEQSGHIHPYCRPELAHHSSNSPSIGIQIPTLIRSGC